MSRTENNQKLENIRIIEKSLVKTYRKEIFSKFIKAIKEYELIKDGDKIAVCISGGKDSFLLAKCMQELKRHNTINFEVEFLVMNPGFSKFNIDSLKLNLKKLEIPAHIYESNIFAVVDEKMKEKPCYMCARMRRGFLYSKAKELGCNKIALGHHIDDVIETIMLGLFYNGQFSSMPPKLKSDNFENMELIRPLYLIREKSVIAWRNYNNLDFMNCGCTVTQTKVDSKRAYIKKLIKELKEENKSIDLNIFKASENINLNTTLGYIKNGEKCTFLNKNL
ncbi:MAG: tRNA 2-thiocytidine biosynthesis TtcA family protein [Bacilli bacterium]